MPAYKLGPWFFEWVANGGAAAMAMPGRRDGAIPLSGHKISGHKSTTIRPPLIALVPALRRGWYLVHDEIDCAGH